MTKKNKKVGLSDMNRTNMEDLWKGLLGLGGKNEISICRIR